MSFTLTMLCERSIRYYSRDYDHGFFVLIATIVSDVVLMYVCTTMRESALECMCWYRDEHSAPREDEREELGGAVEEERVEVPWEVARDKELVAKQAH